MCNIWRPFHFWDDLVSQRKIDVRLSQRFFPNFAFVQTPIGKQYQKIGLNWIMKIFCHFGRRILLRKSRSLGREILRKHIINRQCIKFDRREVILSINIQWRLMISLGWFKSFPGLPKFHDLKKLQFLIMYESQSQWKHYWFPFLVY